ncbi:zinc-binding dehydrogenase [Microbacterium sp. LWH11-1.2]|uniref:zinc-binding dehydrogenase n=1 Tax=unclassified Microbacterium TaxID=2609290 RepID=UPI0031390B5E
MRDTHTDMRALVQQTLDGPEDLILLRVPRPRPAPGEYLIRVGAAGVNFADVSQTRGIYGGGPQAPYRAGFEAVGEIVEIGPRVADPLPLGTRIIGSGPGAFAEYAAVTAAESIRVPAGWSDAQTLGMILNWATAAAALRTVGGLERGETVLIHAAAGGVGQAAVRLARHHGARVVASAASAKHDVLRTLGADVILDSRRPDLGETVLHAVGPVDLVLESVGQATLGVSLAVAKPFTGRVVIFGSASGPALVSTQELIFEHHAQLRGLHIGALAAAARAAYRDLLTELDDLIAQGVYTPGSPQMHALDEGPAVLARLEAGSTIGKHGLDPWR